MYLCTLNFSCKATPQFMDNTVSKTGNFISAGNILPEKIFPAPFFSLNEKISGKLLAEPEMDFSMDTPYTVIINNLNKITGQLVDQSQ